MTDINQLTRLDRVLPGDIIPIFSTASSAPRGVVASALAALLDEDVISQLGAATASAVASATTTASAAAVVAGNSAATATAAAIQATGDSENAAAAAALAAMYAANTSPKILARSSKGFMFFDTFGRPDTSPGDIGTIEGSSSYTLWGPQALAPSPFGNISGNRFVSPAGAVIYAVQDVRGPVNWIGAKIGWSSGNGGASPGTWAFLIPTVGTAGDLIKNTAIHITGTRNQFVIGYIRDQSIVNVKTVVFDAAIPLETETIAEVRIDGNRLYYNICGITGYVKMPVMAYLKLGNFAVWEHYYASSGVSDLIYYDTTWAGSSSQVGMNSLQDLAVAAYRFKNTLWLDSSGQGHTLTPSAAPTVGAGKVGNAVTFVRANSQYLSTPNADDFVLAGKDFMWAMWVNPATLPTSGSYSLLNKGTSTTLEYDVFIDSSGRVNAVISPLGTTASGSLTVTNLATPLVAGTWSLVLVGYDCRARRLGISVGAPNFTYGGYAPGVAAQGLFAGVSDLRIGYNSRLGVSYFDGQIGPVTLFSSPPGHGGFLSLGDALRIYNDGDGLSWPF